MQCNFIVICNTGIIYGFVSNITPKHGIQTSSKGEIQLVKSAESEYSTDLIDRLKKELASANSKIEILQKNMQGFEERIKKPYPNVKYLSYRSKKRILVCSLYFIYYILYNELNIFSH